MSDIWDSYRKFNVKVGVNCDSIEEFKIGSHVEYNDLYEGRNGSGTIFAFAQCGYEPTAWLIDDISGEREGVMLGWCKLT